MNPTTQEYSSPQSQNCDWQLDAPGRLKCAICGKSRAWDRPDPPPKRNCPGRVIPPRRQSGLGDTIAAITDFLRIPKCRPCAKRQAALNRLVPYAGNRVRVLLRFVPHGLGDSVQFVSVLRHVQKHRPDLEITVASHPNRWPLFAPYVAATVPDDHPGAGYLDVPMAWSEPDRCFSAAPSTKAERCLAELFDIDPDPELIGYRVAVSDADHRLAQRYADTIGAPFALIHNDGITGGRLAGDRDAKNVPDAALESLVERLKARGIVPVLLGWHGEQGCLPGVEGVERPGAGHWLWHGEPHAGPGVLAALAMRALVCVGVDSGPGHVFAATETPTVISWVGHAPLNYMPPSPSVLHLVPIGHEANLRPGCDWLVGRDYFQANYNTVEYADIGQALAATVDRLLDAPRYGLPAAADVSLRDCILFRCQPDPRNAHLPGQPHDRPASLDILFQEISRRFTNPIIVETGCVRAFNDWPGAGNFGILAAWYVRHAGGEFHTVDLFADKCDFARERLKHFGPACRVHLSDSVEWLRGSAAPIDVLYLDSLDCYEPGHAEHCLAELRAALPRLTHNAIVCIDDTPLDEHGVRFGKGTLALPWLERNGWRILHAGYQVIASRT